MKDIFLEVQDNFMELGIVLSGVNLEDELDYKAIDEVSFALQKAYKSFEEGLCRTAYMCEKCSKNEEQLHSLVEMIKACAKNGKIDWATNVALVEFMYVIPQILAELRTVYLESFQKRQA